MAKRGAAEDPPGASPSKRQHLDPADTSPSGACPRDAATAIDSTAPDTNHGTDDALSTTSTLTPSSTADVETPVTAASTPKHKFPSDLKTLACTWPGCSKTFNRPARLRDHLNSHTNSRPFKCPWDGCDKDYIEDKHLKQHVKAVHTHERKYVCHCGKSFVTGTRLNRHQAVHIGADRFRCTECGQSFRKKETLHKHVRQEHLDMPAHECPDPLCSEAFGTKSRLKRHFDKFHGEVKFWCTECGLRAAHDGTEQPVGFTTEVLLQDHIKKEHQDCIFCDYKSATLYELHRHIDMHHSGKSVDDRKTHACTFDGCTKRFTTASNLKVHIRVAHMGLRFVCGEVTLAGPDFASWHMEQGCGVGFSTKANLEDHVRFIHLGHVRVRLSKPPAAATDFIQELSGAAMQAKATIACPHCDEIFIRSHHLKKHLARDHDPTSLADQTLGRPAPEQDQALSAWPTDETQDDGFPDCLPPHHDWAHDEASVLLLAQEPSEHHMPGFDIDPALAGP